MKLRKVCSWDSDACKMKLREGRLQDTSNVVCTSAEVADKVVRITNILRKISMNFFAPKWWKSIMLLVSCRVGLRCRWP